MDVKKPQHSGAVRLFRSVISTCGEPYTRLDTVVNKPVLVHNNFMDQNTKDAITHIVEAQAAVLRALQIIASIPHEHQAEGVKPLVETAISHLEETIKAVKNG